MVAVIKCDRHITWTAPLFGRLFPYLIPVLGKPLLEYYIDYCILCNVSKIVFVVEKYNRQLFDFISRISACEIQIKVELSDTSMPLQGGGVGDCLRRLCHALLRQTDENGISRYFRT